MEEILSTRQVAALLGVSVSKLTREVWLGRIKAPPKSPAGDHLWGRIDVERACWVLLHRDLDVVLAERQRASTAEGGLGAPAGRNRP